MQPLVFVDGDQGTTGLQIAQYLRERPALRLLTLPADQRKNPLRRAEALNACDIAILCLPDDAAREAVGWIENPQVRVIDASSAHRTTPGWTYGLPELAPGQAQLIATAGRVSNPGCYPTGALALLRPLVDAGLLPPALPLAIHAVSGYSGRGRATVQAYEAPGVAVPPLQVYGLGLAHKHVPEIQQHAGLTQAPLFVPAYGAYRQGIVLTIPLALSQLAPGTTAARVRDCLQAHHAACGGDTPPVQVLTAAETLALQELDPQRHNGSNKLSLMVFDNAARGHLLLAAVFDNLGKGAAGAAMQNLDLMVGAARPAAVPRVA